MIASMNISRVVPDIRSKQMDESRAFYVDFLGFNVGMDMGFITAINASAHFPPHDPWMSGQTLNY